MIESGSMIVTRRHCLKAALLAGTVSAAALLGPHMALAAPAGARLAGRAGWLDAHPPKVDGGQVFGMPWPRGMMPRGQALAARGGDDAAIPVQSWPLAFWPDGSLKWTAHALPAGGAAGPVHIVPGKPAEPARAILLRETAERIEIADGALIWRIERAGDALLTAATLDGRILLGPVRLQAAVDDAPERGQRRERNPRIRAVVVEQRGPVRAVVRIDGDHGEDVPRLPFTVRLCFSAGAEAVRIVHSFIHDGDPQRDFVSALGLSVDVPMQGAPHDRHVRIATAPDHLFAEAARPLTGLRRDPGQAFREAQVAGRAVPPLDRMAPTVRDVLDRIPVWNDFRLMQHSANGAILQKRTGDGHAWIDADETRRAPGLASVSTPHGGCAIGIHDFWQHHPAALAVEGLGRDVARLTAWLWSPWAEPMDMRPYRGVMGMERYDAQNEGLSITYEDYEPGWDDARGIARTSELTLWALPATPPGADLIDRAAFSASPPRLIAEPETLHRAGVFGSWSLPDRGTAVRRKLEDQLAALVDFYRGEVDRRSWYGFWDYGDVMHTYDADRHQWRYDIGGFAWDNSELSTDLWLWYQALRTHDAATFRLAEAMTRHTGEVDVYHLGRFQGLGTRHGVQHFSDSSKQPRISNAVYRRIYYYLTADERSGDLMRDLLGSEQRLRDVVIERKVPGEKPPPPPPGMVAMSFGTVWCSLASAWLTEWERSGDRRWRDRLAAGMDSIGRMPAGWLAGGALYDLSSGRFLPRAGQSISHLNAVFGAVEVNAELLELIDVPGYRRAWLDYCRYYNAPKEEFEKRFGPRNGSDNLREGHSRLTAYAAHEERDAQLADRAADEFFSGKAGLGTVDGDPRVRLLGGIVEWPGLSTNAAAQWGLAAIQNLALVPEALDRRG